MTPAIILRKLISFGFSALIILGLFILIPGLGAAEDFARIEQDQETGDTQPVQPSQPSDSADGLAIHAERCATCHGQFGLGDGELAAGLPNPPASHASQEFIRAAVPADMFSTITDGRIDKGMPPFGPVSTNPLTEDQRWNVIAAIYSLGTPIESVEQGRQIFDDQCAACHGTEGQGDGPESASFGNADLAINSTSYWLNSSNQEVHDLLSASNFDGAHEFELSSDDLWATVDFIRTFSYIHVDAFASLRPIENGSISGVVRNGTSGESLSSQATASLRGFTPELQITVELTNTVEPGGEFNFDVRDVPQDLFYRVTVDYGGIDFSSDFGQLSSENPELNLPVTVFEKSSDPEAISIDQLHIILGFGQDFANVSEFYVASNSEDAVFVGESGQAGDGTFYLDLPPGAQNVNFQRGFGSVDSFIPASEVISVAGGWADTLPIRPGTGTVNLLVNYSLPYDDETTFSHALNYPTSLVNLVIPELGVDLVNNGEWTDTGQQVMGNSAVATYGQVALPPGNQLSISLEGEPQTAEPASSNLLRNNQNEILIGAAVAVGVIVIAAVLIRQWRTTPAVELDRQALIEEIALLDESFEAGEIEQADYERERAELKAELLAVWQENNSGQ